MSIIKNKLGILASLSFLFLLFVAGSQALAQGFSDPLGVQYGAATGLSATDPRLIVAYIIRAAMGLLGILTLVIIVYGGFLWMTAGGNEEQTTKAKSWIFSGVIGLIIILASYSIASFVIDQLVAATTQGTGGVAVPFPPPPPFLP